MPHMHLCGLWHCITCVSWSSICYRQLSDAGKSSICCGQAAGISMISAASSSLYLMHKPATQKYTATLLYDHCASHTALSWCIGDRGPPLPRQQAKTAHDAFMQAHRSGMVTAIGANTGIITCGIFGSVMWWPEAELRSSVVAAGMRLPSEDRVRSLLSGSESPRSAMSKVLHRYFTPSSAALAQATLQRMHSSGDLQGSGTGLLGPVSLQDSVDLDDGAQSARRLPAAEQAAAPPPAAATVVEQAPPPEAAPAVAAAQTAPAATSSDSSASSKHH